MGGSEQAGSPRDEAASGADATGDASTPDEGIFGNLPRTRPTVRSPRRAEATEPEAGRVEEADEAAGAERGGREAEVEALAKAGISLAGEAAGLGLRVAGRAAAALRDAVERR